MVSRPIGLVVHHRSHLDSNVCDAGHQTTHQHCFSLNQLSQACNTRSPQTQLTWRINTLYTLLWLVKSYYTVLWLKATALHSDWLNTLYTVLWLATHPRSGGWPAPGPACWGQCELEQTCGAAGGWRLPQHGLEQVLRTWWSRTTTLLTSTCSREC